MPESGQRKTSVSLVLIVPLALYLHLFPWD